MMEKSKKIKILFTVFLSLSLIYFSVFVPYFVRNFSQSHLETNTDQVEAKRVGIVFGASVRPDRTPSDMLRDRLDTAIELFIRGKIQDILVSGDNSTKKYNEPLIMYQYLVEKGIPTEHIFRDYAGLRTYDTCIRAKTLWNVNKAILITQEYHLYRAIYTCEKLGIESVGFSATKHQYVVEDSYRIREYFAIIKGFFDLNILRPSYIGGKVEGNLSEYDL